jgi:diketogulonate reductase-like aldo/keto reductase
MVTNLTLKNGVKIPILGLGTWELKGKKCEDSVKAALNMGYSHIDTADYYQNHRSVGNAIKGFERKNLFITTKIWPPQLAYDQVLEAFERFLKELGTSYVDLLLIHWRDARVPLKETFRAFRKLADENKIRACGVSNFTIDDLNDAKKATDLPITVNQVEFHPLLFPKELLDYCNKEKIVVTAYSPLGRGRVFSDPTIKKIAEKYNRTPGQIALRWLVEKNVVVIPKASSEGHLRENLSIFDFKLEKNDAKKIDEL